MNKNTLVVSFIIVASLTIIISNAFNNKTEIPYTESITEEKHYILKDFDGRLALFSNESGVPIEIYNIFTDSLPEEDKSEIKTGIKAKNEEELQKLIEAYLS